VTGGPVQSLTTTVFPKRMSARLLQIARLLAAQVFLQLLEVPVVAEVIRPCASLPRLALPPHRNHPVRPKKPRTRATPLLLTESCVVPLNNCAPTPAPLA